MAPQVEQLIDQPMTPQIADRSADGSAERVLTDPPMARVR